MVASTACFGRVCMRDVVETWFTTTLLNHNLVHHSRGLASHVGACGLSKGSGFVAARVPAACGKPSAPIVRVCRRV
jgi:hypothetical protein